MVGFIVGVIAFAAWTGAVWSYSTNAAVEHYQAKLDKADAKIAAQAADAVQEGENKISDMQVAYQVGKETATVVEKKVIVRVAAETAQYDVFKNPACVLPPSSLALLQATLRGARAGVVLPPETVPAPEQPAAAQKPAAASPQPPKPVPLHRAGS